jgi:hypothetical protein
MNTITTLSPRQTFEDNVRPAILLLRVYRLLESKEDSTDRHELLDALRGVVNASADEDLMLIYNEIFLGLVRERAQIPRSALRQATLCHLLRQAVVASCTALETYLPALLRENLPVMISVRGRDFFPRGDDALRDYLSDLTFSLDETLRLLGMRMPPPTLPTRSLGWPTSSTSALAKGSTWLGLFSGCQAHGNRLETT